MTNEALVQALFPSLGFCKTCGQAGNLGSEEEGVEDGVAGEDVRATEGVGDLM